ncbi:MAG TPA: hypothetical protein VIJ52_02415 [Pseudolabrys sp.]
MPRRIVAARDKMQKDYRYLLSAPAAIRLSISSASTPANRYRNGGARVGCILMIRADGSSGIAVIT